MNKFTKEFKEKAIKLKKQGMHPNKIFTNTGINISEKQKDYASKLISRWKTKTKEVKPNKFNKEELNTLKRIKKEEERNKIKYLEAQVAYLQAENDFLTQLPKKK